MTSWLGYLRNGLTRKPADDQLADKKGYAGTKANLRNLEPFLRRHWRKGAVGAVLILFNSVLSFPDPLIYRYLVDNVILGQQLNLLVVVVVLLGIFQIAGMLSSTLQSFYFARFEQEVLLDIQQDLLDRTLRLPKAFFDDKQTGYLMSRLQSDVQGLRWFFSSTIVYIASQSLRFLGGVALLVYLRWELAIVVLIVIPVLVLSVRFFSGKLRVLSHQGMERQANVARTMQESISATTLIKAFSSEKRTVGRLMDQLQAARQIAMEQITVGSLANLAIGAMPSVTRAIVLVAGAFWVVRGNWTLGSLLAFQSYVEYVYGPAMFLAQSNLQLQNALAALERVSVLYDLVPEENLDSGMLVEQLRGEIEFKGVSFAYDGREPVVENISFCVRPGEHVAIVGPSGVGKTTLLSLLLRFYKPTQGEIWFDGSPASAFQVRSLRQRIGYVPQSTLLLTGTIMDNLRYGDPDASDAQVIQAAQVAGIHDFISGLAEGYQSLVGERGVNLSEGQKQRIAIARALIKCPDIVVLDEPTSALDSLVEKSIFEALPAVVRDKTLFVVAHRLATSRKADRILLLNEKRLVAVGNHDELMQHSDLYRALVASQQIDGPLAA